MKLFIKYEEKINNVLIKVSDKIYSKIEKYIPQFYFRYKARFNQKKDLIIQKTKDFISFQITRFKEKVVKPALAFDYVGFFYKAKDKVLQYISNKKKQVFTKDYWQQKIDKLKAFGLILVDKIKNFNFGFIFSVIAAIAVSYFTLNFLYNQLLNYLEHLKEGEEIIYSEEEVGKGHSEYYKEESRVFTFYSIIMPVYTENDFVRTVLLTFTIVGSNSYIPLYFKEHEIEVRNHLVSRIRVMDTNFLLTQQGKDVIKDKARIELNDFLKIKKIRGEIKKVLINDILTN